MQHTSWQLAIIDYDLPKNHKQLLVVAPMFLDLLETERSSSPAYHGSIVYIVSTKFLDINTECEFISQNVRDELRNITSCIRFGVPFCHIWDPNENMYRWCISWILKPLITEKDIIDAELKFGISLNDYTI